MAKRRFGHIPGYSVGQLFESRAALAAAGLHRPTMAGICGGEREGAESIVLSEAYEDDEDLGDEIVYTGEGGRDMATGKQVASQSLSGGNLALVYSQTHGLPVRVLRRVDPNHPASKGMRFRYDGLYRVVEHCQEMGKSGYLVWRYRMAKLPE